MDTETGHQFTRATAGLPRAQASRVIEVDDGDRVELRIAPVTKRIGDATVRMLGYNGSIPGPTLSVREGSEIAVHVANDTDLETTVHWHGLRLENRYDGTARDPGADPRRRAVHLPASRSPTPACTGTTRTSARTTARSWASTATSSSTRPTPTTGRRCTARSC